MCGVQCVRVPPVGMGCKRFWVSLGKRGMRERCLYPCLFEDCQPQGCRVGGCRSVSEGRGGECPMSAVAPASAAAPCKPK